MSAPHRVRAPAHISDVPALLVELGVRAAAATKAELAALPTASDWVTVLVAEFMDESEPSEGTAHVELVGRAACPQNASADDRPVILAHYDAVPTMSHVPVVFALRLPCGENVSVMGIKRSVIGAA